MNRLVVLAPILLALTGGCDGDGSSLPVDGAPQTDAALIDAGPVDGPPTDSPLGDAAEITDASTGAIATACMHACAAIGVCFMDSDSSCEGECSADLADCSDEQVQAVDACSTQGCGDLANPETSPLLMCLTAIACIEPR